MNERTYYGNTGDLILTDVQYVDGIDETPSGTITCTFPGTLEGALAAAPELGTSSEHLPESTREELGTTVRVRLVLIDPVWRHKTKLMMSSTEPADPENWHEKETLEDAIKTVVQSDAGKLLIEKVRKGVTSYNAERLEWAETSYARSLSAAVSGLSQIDTPPGDPPAISGNWRLTGVSAQKSKSEKYWKVDKTWTASDSGAKWDPDLYAG